MRRGEREAVLLSHPAPVRRRGSGPTTTCRHFVFGWAEADAGAQPLELHENFPKCAVFVPLRGGWGHAVLCCPAVLCRHAVLCWWPDSLRGGEPAAGHFSADVLWPAGASKAPDE